MRSLRARLVLLFLLLALATAGVFVLGTQRLLHAGWHGVGEPLVADYLDRLSAEIGSPPDAARARALAERLPITITIDGPRVRFESHPESFPEHRRKPRDAAAQGRGRGDAQDDDPGEHGYWRQRQTADGHRIVFGLSGLGTTAERPRRIGGFTLGGLLLLTGIAYLVVRRLLLPIDAIGAGAARFGRGDFGAPIPVARRDELGELAEHVNTMARSLQARLEDKSSLLLAISHELRSPLTRARLNAELVEDGAPRQALLADLAEMRELITSLLESERIAGGAPALRLAEVDLRALAHGVVAAMPGHGAEGPLHWDWTDPPSPIAVDPTRVELLLRNLLANALRHGASAPAPTLFLRREGSPGDGSPATWALGVRDHGSGVAPEQLQRLSQAFYRPDSARTRGAGGVGLGLYLCRLVAQAHGGHLSIRNAEPGLEVAMVWQPARLRRA